MCIVYSRTGELAYMMPYCNCPLDKRRTQMRSFLKRKEGFTDPISSLPNIFSGIRIVLE